MSDLFARAVVYNDEDQSVLSFRILRSSVSSSSRGLLEVELSGVIEGPLSLGHSATVRSITTQPSYDPPPEREINIE